MLRVIGIAAVALALAAILTRSRGPRLALIALLGLMLLYTILKLSGAIDAMAPDRYGGIWIPYSQVMVFMG